MADFKQAYAITCKIEGGYANNSNDRGGETWKGIARKMHPEWSGWKIVDTLKSLGNFPANLNNSSELESLVSAFYKEEFWNFLSLDNVTNQLIANELFDTSVNMGQGIAAQFLQRCLNITNRNGADYADLVLDGQIGPKTIAVLNNHKRPNEVLKVLNCLQGERYISICEHNPSQEEFLLSWMSRVAI